MFKTFQTKNILTEENILEVKKKNFTPIHNTLTIKLVRNSENISTF